MKRITAGLLTMGLAGWSFAATRPAPGTVKIVVHHDPASALPLGAGLLASFNATAVAERQTVTILDVPAVNAAQLQAALAPLARAVEIRDDYDILDFAVAPIDIRNDQPTLDAAWSRTVPLPAPARDAYVVQFTGPPAPTALDDLRALGITILDPIPQNGFVILATTEAISTVAARSDVQYAMLHQPIHKISAIARAWPLAFADVAVVVTTDPEGILSTQLLASVSLDPLPAPEPASDRLIYRTVLPTTSLQSLAGLPGVIWIETNAPAALTSQREAHLIAGSPYSTITTGVLKPIIPAPPTTYRTTFLANTAISNYVATVGIADLDTGFDKGSTTDVHPDFKDTSGSSIVSTIHNFGSDGLPNDDCYGHGTMVAGVLAGNAGASSYNTTTKDNGSAYGDADYYMGFGVAPGIHLYEGRIFSQLSGALSYGNSWPAVYGTFPNTGYGYNIVNNSWTMLDTTYNTHSQILDRIVRHASATMSDSAPPIRIYFAAGQNEEGNGITTITAPGTAKNVITVGGTETFNPCQYPLPTWLNPVATNGTSSDNANQIWTPSRYGPTVDGRIKPDIVAPASAIEAPRTRSVHNETTGCWASNAVGATIDATMPRDQEHYWSRGTSFSSPAAAAGGALLFTWYKNNLGHANPSPAMLKAMQINLAQDINPVNGPHPPEAHQGWGRTELSRAFQTDGRYIWNDQANILTAQSPVWFGPSVIGDYYIKNTSRPVTVTLVWSDRFGPTGSGTTLVNDLDLVVINASGLGYAYGNEFGSNGHSVFHSSGGTIDHKNNVEQVIFTAAEAGNHFHIEVTVDAGVLHGDGINQWNGSTPQQDFAIFIDNAYLP